MDRAPETWSIRFDHYDPADEGRREVLLALGNGLLVTRAAAPEATDDAVHYPGTYWVGCYNRRTTRIQGEAVDTESLVNLPHGLSLTFRIDGGPWFSLDAVEILSYRQELNMQQALLHRTICFRDQQGRKTRLQERRLVSMDQPHLMALELSLEVDWSGELEIRSAIDGRVANDNVPRYAPYNRHHLEVLSAQSINEDSIELLARTNQSAVDIAVAARTRVSSTRRSVRRERNLTRDPVSGSPLGSDWITDHITLSVEKGDTLTVEKCVAYYTSSDANVSDVRTAAREALAEAPDFDALRAAHVRAWEPLWQRSRLEVDRPDQLRYFRIHTYHILLNLSPHTIGQDVGVPPSGWQGEEYHGQIFWDELFVFPFLLFRFPALARSLLLYRYRRLPAARQLAEEQGYRGAMFPWRSARTGREETPRFQWNLLSDHWMPDHTHLQRHIGAIVAYNVWQYVQVTDDQSFLADYGAELILEIARFWASLAQYHPDLDRYEICGVVGPDEYHTHYPEADAPGINNNTYTNVMAVWTLRQARAVLDQLPTQRRQELQDKLVLREEELDQWDDVSRKMRIVFQDDHTLSQFEGYDQLPEFDLPQFRRQHGHQRLDWALEAEGDTVGRYQIAKQADTALLLYLFSPAELTALLERLGYSVDEAGYQRTIRYQLARTVHESSLSRIVYAGALAHLGMKEHEQFFQEAQQIDLSPHEDHGTTEGIHLGAMGGTLAVLQHHYLGLGVASDTLEINPSLPTVVGQVRMVVCFRGAKLSCEVTANDLTVVSASQNDASVKISHRGQVVSLKPGASVRFRISG